MMNHTPEPWTFDLIYADTTPGFEKLDIVGPDGRTCPCSVYGDGIDGLRAHATRIVACVNACAGINPEAVPELLAACKRGQELIRHLCMGPLDAAAQYGPDYEPPTSDDIVAEIRLIQAAIAKAEEGT